jgi:hypothetical protein
MGTATLLSHIQTVCNELALPSPTSVIGSTDSQVIQLLALANREGKEAAAMSGKDFGWQALRKLDTITMVTGTAAYSLPSDLQFAIPGTFWDVTNKWQLLGPLSPAEWDVLQYGISPAGPRRRFRIYGGKIQISPTPTASDNGNTLVHEYYSNTWCQSAALAAQSVWTADTDTYLLDDDAMQLGIKWRFLRAKGLDYSDEYEQWDTAINRALSRTSMSRYLPINSISPAATQLISDANVPDTGFGS